MFPLSEFNCVNNDSGNLFRLKAKLCNETNKKKLIYHKRYARLATGLLPGVKNGKKSGKK